ncbi:MAG: adenylate/guanylate cyclase domain-containing protein [Chloroherpetonaceae bacterium]|nr:adenylate/guanylate cyclase domain-containing protein [Chloroherpetonaceae bacterium]
MRITIQTKLFLLTFGITTVVLLAVVFSVNYVQTKTIEAKISRDFSQTQAVFNQAQSLRYERLVESAYLISENSLFKANVELRDPASVYFSIEEFSKFLKVDVFFVTDPDGNLLAFLGDTSRHGVDFSFAPTVQKALRGEDPEINPTLPDLWSIGIDTIFQIVTVPIFTANDNRLLGTTTLGIKLTQFEAKQLKGNSNIDITFFLGNVLVASTIDSLKKEDARNFYSSFEKEVQVNMSQLKASDVFESSLFNEIQYTFISPLGRGAPGYYVATVKKSQELQILTTLRETILYVAGISLLLTIVFAVLMGRLLSKPIVTLSGAMTRVQNGDLGVEVTPTTKDEIGQLSIDFNKMIVGLRERMQLQRYVGSHTLEMIQKTSGSSENNQTMLGGLREEITMLFSDIRGFTSYSESRSPEEVIGMLNRYLGFQADLVSDFGGSVDKFVGDEMVALFAGKDGLKRALQCAIEIQKRKQIERSKNPNDSMIDIGIGVNFGAVVLGNMGAQDRMDYTVIGSAVNLSARLCSAAKGGQILVRKDLLRLLELERNFQIGTIESMTFKGISTPLEIAEIRY